MTRHIRELNRMFPDVSITKTRGGHLVATIGTTRVFMAATPSDHRAIHNIAAMIRRAERGLNP